MKAEILKEAGIDYERGVKRFVGRSHLFEKALGKFLRDTTFERIRQAWEEKNQEKLLSSAHEFKGMCGNIALTSLYEKSDAIVRMLRENAFSPEELEASYSRLAVEYQRIYNAVAAAAEE